MRSYHCVFHPPSSDEEETETIEAPTPERAFKQFIQRRKADGWSPREIYSTSHARLMDEDSSCVYRLNAYGELTTRSRHH